MSDLVTIETYSDSTEAQLAKNDLLESGIKAVLVGEESDALWRMPTEIGMMKLQVAAEDAARAAEILKSPARFSSDEEIADEAEGADDVSEKYDEEEDDEKKRGKREVRACSQAVRRLKRQAAGGCRRQAAHAQVGRWPSRGPGCGVVRRSAPHHRCGNPDHTPAPERFRLSNLSRGSSTNGPVALGAMFWSGVLRRGRAGMPGGTDSNCAKTV